MIRKDNSSSSPKSYDSSSDSNGSSESGLEEQLQSLSMDTKEAVMEAAVKPGTIGEPISLSTNAYGIEFAAVTTIYNYHVDVHGELSPTKVIEFSKQSKDDFLLNDRRRKCMNVLSTVMRNNTRLFRDPDIHWYDGQHLFFSTLDFFRNMQQTYTEFRLPGSAFDNDPELATVPFIVFGIKREFDYIVQIDKQSVVQSCPADNMVDRNRIAIQFLEIAINEYVYRTPERFHPFEKGKVYLSNPTEFFFTAEDCPLVGDGVRLYVGTAKGVQFVEGPGGRGQHNAALVIDSKKAAFHEDQIFHYKVADILNTQEFATRLLTKSEADRINQVIRGISVQTEYRGKKETHYVLCVSEKNAREATFETRAQQNKPTTIINVEQYFQMRYNITLEFPLMNLLVTRKNGRKSLLPMELTKVVFGQRVSIAQQTAKQSQMTTRNCAVLPARRIDNTERVAEAMGLQAPKNPHVINAGIELMQKPLVVRGRQLQPPSAMFRDRSSSRERREASQQTPQDGKWRFDKPLLRPCEVQIWGIYLLHRQGERGVNRDLLVAFAKGLIKEAGNKGVHLPAPADCQVRAVTRQDCAEVVREYIQNAAQANCQFLFFITGDDIPAHPHIKYYERKCLLRTQDMKLSNAIKVVQQNKWQTLENVFLKTNVKNGGLNYELRAPRGYAHGAIDKWLPPHRLVLGIGFSHAPFVKDHNGEPLKDVPSVIGYACNMKSNPFEFVGGFNFLSKGKEGHEVISYILEDVLRIYRFQHHRTLPTELLIYQSCVSESSYQTILSHELPRIRDTLAKIADYAEAVGGQKITFISVSKAHNVRIFPEKINAADIPSKQNILAGIVIDEQLTHPRFKQFFLNSHNTIKGSAKTPCYTILVDDLNFSMDDIVGLTNTLAYAHQIVGLPTSLPTPLYVANLYAERGRMLLTQQLENDIIHDEGVDARTSEERRHALSNGNEHCWLREASLTADEKAQRLAQRLRQREKRKKNKTTTTTSSNSSSSSKPTLSEALEKMMAMRPVVEFTNLLNYVGTRLEYYRLNA